MGEAGPIDVEQRVVDLELRFMKLERDARELSDVVAGQQRTIDGLTLELKRLRDRPSDGEANARQEEPPHY